MRGRLSVSVLYEEALENLRYKESFLWVVYIKISSCSPIWIGRVRQGEAKQLGLAD